MYFPLFADRPPLPVFVGGVRFKDSRGAGPDQAAALPASNGNATPIARSGIPPDLPGLEARLALAQNCWHFWRREVGIREYAAVIGATRGRTAAWVLAIALSTHALLPYFPFPRPEDYTFVPLAEAWANPDLFPRDDQIQGFGPAAWVYIAVYWLAKSTLGVASGFWVATVLLTVAAVFAIHAIMRRLGAPGIALPLAVAVGLMAARSGIGSSALGGLASGFFHHQWIALVLVFWAFVATLARRPALAGLALGVAVYAQPVTALHGAIAIAGACATLGRQGLRALGVTALAAVFAALPVWYRAITADPAAPVPAARMIADGYLFSAPDHYSLGWSELALGWGYLALGLISAMLSRRARPAEATMAAGLLGGLGALHLSATLFYGAVPGEFVSVYMLDATRSSPLFFALAAALFAATAERQASQGFGNWRDLLPFAAATAIAVVIMAANALATGWFFLLAGLLVLATPGRAVPRLALTATLVLVFVMVTPRYQLRAPAKAPRIEMFEWANRETPAEALFVIPPGMQDFRLFAQRSAYVDIGMFAAAGPRRAWFARSRLEQISEPGPAALAARGWNAVALWDRGYLIAATCGGIVKMMRETGADYFVRPVHASADGTGGDTSCAGNPAIAFANSALTVYTLDRNKARRRP